MWQILRRGRPFYLRPYPCTGPKKLALNTVKVKFTASRFKFTCSVNLKVRFPCNSNFQLKCMFEFSFKVKFTCNLHHQREHFYPLPAPSNLLEKKESGRNTYFSANIMQYFVLNFTLGLYGYWTLLQVQKHHSIIGPCRVQV